jgi:hypothetical protein
VAHAHILDTWEAEIWNIMVQGQPRKKHTRHHHTQKKESQAWWYTPVIPAIAGSLKQEDQGPGQLGQKARPCGRMPASQV